MSEAHTQSNIAKHEIADTEKTCHHRHKFEPVNSFKQINATELVRQLDELQRRLARDGESQESARLLHDLQLHQIELEIQYRDLRDTHKTLEAACARYADLYDFAPVGYATLDEHGVIAEANLTAAEVFDTERSDLPGTPFAVYLAPGHNGAFSKHLHKAKTNARRNTLETQIKDKHARLHHVRLITIYEPANGTGMFRTAILDITEEKQATERMRLQSQIIDSIAEGIALIQPENGVIHYSNPSFERMFGLQQGQTVIDTPLSVVHHARASSQQSAESLTRQSEQGSSRRSEMQITDEAGNHLFYDVSIRTLNHSEYESAWLVVCQDITARKAAENEAQKNREELAHAARIHVTGELAAGLAHELSQPLTAIGNYCDAAMSLVKPQGMDTPPMEQLLGKIHRQVKRSYDIVYKLRAFMRRSATEKKPVDLSETLKDAISLVNHWMLEKSIDLHLSLPGGQAPRILADPVQVQQVMINLLTNSAEAIEQARSRRRHVHIKTAVRDNHAQITVQDSGPGVDRQWLERIFTIFETTKSEGMGMGLAISRSIVEDHGGNIWAERNPSNGTSIHFTLPLAPSPEEQS
jgi:PAS domain S-box-containing protein